MKTHVYHGYSFFSIGQNGEEQAAIIAYVKNQKRRHADKNLWPEWEETNEISPATASGGRSTA